MKPGKVLLKGLFCAAFITLAGCGFKGPLVVPEEAEENAPQQQQTSSEPQTSSQAKEK